MGFITSAIRVCVCVGGGANCRLATTGGADGAIPTSILLALIEGVDEILACSEDAASAHQVDVADGISREESINLCGKAISLNERGIVASRELVEGRVLEEVQDVNDFPCACACEPQRLREPPGAGIAKGSEFLLEKVFFCFFKRCQQHLPFGEKVVGGIRLGDCQRPFVFQLEGFGWRVRPRCAKDILANKRRQF